MIRLCELELDAREKNIVTILQSLSLQNFAWYFNALLCRKIINQRDVIQDKLNDELIMDTKTKLNKLNTYCTYLNKKLTHENLQNVFLRDEVKLKEWLAEEGKAIPSCQLNEYLSWETDGDYESNDEGGSYFYIHHATFSYPDGVTCTFGYEGGEWLIDALGSTNDEDCGYVVVSEIVEPFTVTIGE